MRRMIALILAVVLSLGLAVCGVKEEIKPSETNAPVHKESDIPTVVGSDAPPTEGTDVVGSRVLIAYFSVPKDVSTDGVVLQLQPQEKSRFCIFGKKAKEVFS